MSKAGPSVCLEQGLVADGLNGQHGGEANHRAPAVDHLGKGRERAEALSILVALEGRHQRGGDDEAEDGDDAGRLIGQLSQHALA